MQFLILSWSMESIWLLVRSQWQSRGRSLGQLAGMGHSALLQFSRTWRVTASTKAGEAESRVSWGSWLLSSSRKLLNEPTKKSQPLSMKHDASPQGLRTCHRLSSHLASWEPKPEVLESGGPWPVTPHLIVQCSLQRKEIPAEPSRQSL